MTNNTSQTRVHSHESAASNELHSAIRFEHDIKASLAIANGFNQALELSFADLCDTYQKIWDVHTDLLTAEQAECLAEQQSDCWHCLSQVQRSIERLSSRLAAGLDARHCEVVAESQQVSE